MKKKKIKIFQKEPFFKGMDNHDQLCQIAKILGTKELYEYANKYDIQIEPHFKSMIGIYPKKPWKSFVNSNNRHLASEDAIDFVDKLLKYDHHQRLTAREAMNHPFFDSLKNSF